jgi:hypothetical protein
LEWSGAYRRNGAAWAKIILPRKLPLVPGSRPAVITKAEETVRTIFTRYFAGLDRCLIERHSRSHWSDSGGRSRDRAGPRDRGDRNTGAKLKELAIGWWQPRSGWWDRQRPNPPRIPQLLHSVAITRDIFAGTITRGRLNLPSTFPPPLELGRDPSQFSSHGGWGLRGAHPKPCCRAPDRDIYR